MQDFENNQFDVDDPMDDAHGPVRLPLLKKGTHLMILLLVSKIAYKLIIRIYIKNIIISIISDRQPQVKSENSLEYPFQKNVYPSLTELITPESLMTLQVLLKKIMLVIILVVR